MQITSVEGDFREGGIVTIRGEGFGNKARPGPLVWDPFEGPLGQPVQGWELYGQPVVYTPDGALQDFTANYNSTLKRSSPGIERMLVMGAFKMEVGGPPGRNAKLLQWRQGELHESCPAVYATQFPVSGSGVQQVQRSDSDAIVDEWDLGSDLRADGAWHRLESWLDMLAGRWHLRIDDWLFAGLDGVKWTPENLPLNHLWIGHYFAKDGGAWARRWWRWLYIDDTQARVELRLEDWSEPQIPVSWTDTEIVFLLRRGLLPCGAAYLMVFDETDTPQWRMIALPDPSSVPDRAPEPEPAPDNPMPRAWWQRLFAWISRLFAGGRER